MVSGLKLSDSLDQLALLYLATIQAIALGTRHILSAMNRGGQVPGDPTPTTADSHPGGRPRAPSDPGYRIHTIFACGGDTKNPVFLREHADATGCRVVLPAEPEAVLLGAAILGAVASGDQPTVLAAMGAMTRVGRVVEPTRGAVARYFEAKYKVFHRMHDDQLAYRETMEEGR
jgi:ribulose kinase